jgi:hypothetical protein
VVPQLGTCEKKWKVAHLPGPGAHEPVHPEGGVSNSEAGRSVAVAVTAKYFTTCDAKSGFWQLELDHDSSLLTTFWTPFGRYRWLRMPFGVSNAPEVFQRAVCKFAAGLENFVPLADNFLIFELETTMQRPRRTTIDALRRSWRNLGILVCAKGLLRLESEGRILHRIPKFIFRE